MPLRHFVRKDFFLKSKALKNNPLKDPFEKKHYVLVPKKKGVWPVVWLLSGLDTPHTNM